VRPLAALALALGALAGAGWTRSAAWGDPSTLSAADEARCTKALASTACP
jgi:hypothetical protein